MRLFYGRNTAAQLWPCQAVMLHHLTVWMGLGTKPGRTTSEGAVFHSLCYLVVDRGMLSSVSRWD